MRIEQIIKIPDVTDWIYNRNGGAIVFDAGDALFDSHGNPYLMGSRTESVQLKWATCGLRGG